MIDQLYSGVMNDQPHPYIIRETRGRTRWKEGSNEAATR